MASGDGAAARLRVALRRAGAGDCAACSLPFPAAALRVDHRIALVDGGRDTDLNLQVLCSPCHVKKTSAEASARVSRPGESSR
ncbi:MAG: HNH endonuclease [Acidimicrobiia bacterium]